MKKNYNDKLSTWLDFDYSKSKEDDLYLILCLRHDGVYGKEFCLWWGYGTSSSGYSSDVRTAHRFTYKEAIKINDEDDIMIPVSKLGNIPWCNTKEELGITTMLIQKGDLNNKLGMKLK